MFILLFSRFQSILKFFIHYGEWHYATLSLSSYPKKGSGYYAFFLYFLGSGISILAYALPTKSRDNRLTYLVFGGFNWVTKRVHQTPLEDKSWTKPERT
jgi:hypothetical protein